MRMADSALAAGSALTVLKRRWCWHPGQMFALCKTVALQCGHTRVAPSVLCRATLIFLAGQALNFSFLVFPAKLDVPAHPRAGCDRDGACLDIPDDDAALEHIDSLGGFDVV